MIGHCFNPLCNEELRYLRRGTVFAWETGSAPDFHSEFFWLCPSCSKRFHIVPDEEGRPALVSNHEKRAPKQKPIRASRVRRVLQEVLNEPHTKAPVPISRVA